MIFDFFQNQKSQGSQDISSADLMEAFVNNDIKTMSKDTLYKSLDKLQEEGKIEKPEKGVYQLKIENENEKGEEELPGL